MMSSSILKRFCSSRAVRPFSDFSLHRTRTCESNASTAIVAALFSSFGSLMILNCDTSEEVTNWSSTHRVITKELLRPESTEEAERIIMEAQKMGKKIRIVGNMLSPNGMGLSSDSMLTMSLCDKILAVDVEAQTVRVQSGATVQQIVDALKPYGLTLQNYASISEQQIGGFLQVGAHGTGLSIPPCDEQIIAMRLVTPSFGPIELSKEQNSGIFHLSKIGLGAFGLVTEVTLKCIPRHMLSEKTVVMSRDEVKKNHSNLLAENRHLRYMWIPYTESVVVVACNPVSSSITSSKNDSNPATDEQKLKPFLTLLEKHMSYDEALKMGMTEMRDKLIAVAPLDSKWISTINHAEVDVLRNFSGTRVDFSDKILGFDCGGQQWVQEVAFPLRTNENGGRSDIDFVIEALDLIEKNNVPAPAPIEQRWTAASSAAMSPSHGSASSWVGIIMYLPTDDEKMRNDITEAFFNYQRLLENELWEKYECVQHWAKIEIPKTESEAIALQKRMNRKYPMLDFKLIHALCDPNRILVNDFIEAVVYGNGSRSQIFEWEFPRFQRNQLKAATPHSKQQCTAE